MHKDDKEQQSRGRKRRVGKDMVNGMLEQDLPGTSQASICRADSPQEAAEAWQWGHWALLSLPNQSLERVVLMVPLRDPYLASDCGSQLSEC